MLPTWIHLVSTFHVFSLYTERQQSIFLYLWATTCIKFKVLRKKKIFRTYVRILLYTSRFYCISCTFMLLNYVYIVTSKYNKVKCNCNTGLQLQGCLECIARQVLLSANIYSDGNKQQFISKTSLSSVLPYTVYPFRTLCTYIYCTAGTAHECITYQFNFCCNNSGWLSYRWKRFCVFLCRVMYVYTTCFHTKASECHTSRYWLSDL